MKRMVLTVTGMVLLLLFSLSTIVTGEGDSMSYDDEADDVVVLGEDSGFEGDIDIISMTCDASGDPIVLTMTVVGDIVADYGENGTNNYVLSLDLDGDEDHAEIGVQLTGDMVDEEGYMTISTPSTIEYLTKGNYDISGSTITVRVDKAYMGDFEEIMDFTGTGLQMMSSGTGTDWVNQNFGSDDKPYDGSSSADDDDTPDDDTDDDEEEDPACGGVILIPVAVFMMLILVAGFIKRRN